MAQYNILLAEDVEMSRETWRDSIMYKCRALGKPDVVVDEAANGLELVKLAKAGSYSLILTDNQMPGMHGIDAIREIRRFDKSTPAYLMSSAIVKDEELKASEASGFIRKIEFSERILEVLKEILA